jgi:hypothetical protein
MSFLNCSDPANAYGASSAIFRTPARFFSMLSLRFDVVTNGLALALGVFQHVSDIGHMSFFRDLRVAFRPGANRRSMSRVILIPRL